MIPEDDLAVLRHRVSSLTRQLGQQRGFGCSASRRLGACLPMCLLRRVASWELQNTRVFKENGEMCRRNLNNS